MIVDDLSACDRYTGLRGRFDLAFAYLRRFVTDEDEAAAKALLTAADVWASIATKSARAAADAGFEYHARCADVHLCLRGEEQMGWREDGNGLAVRQPFTEEKDFGLYAGTPDQFVRLRGHRFAIFFPGELHAPFIGHGEMTKICVKVRLPLLS